MKVIKSSTKINPYGGVNFVLQAFKSQGLAKLITQYLGDRPAQSTYSYSDIFRALWACNMCGAEVLEDSHHLAEYFGKIPGFKIPSADTIGRVIKGLALAKNEIVSSNKVRHEFNTHPPLNRLLLALSRHLGLLEDKQQYTLDYDNVILFNNKSDSLKTYQHKQGYCPGVAFIRKLPVFLESRNGNSPAKYRMLDTLKSLFDHLNAQGIGINKFRSDSAAYQFGIFQLIDQQNIQFYIRARMGNIIGRKIRQIEDWRTVKMEGYDTQVASMNFRGKDQKDKNVYRAVIRRIPSQSGQVNLFTGDNMLYAAIITNDWDSSEEEVIHFYNQRGAIEKNFDILNNDFNWSKLPFSYLHHNTAFMLISAMSMVFYQYLIKQLAPIIPGLKPQHRLKRFIFTFMIVPSKWIRKSRQSFLRIYSTKPYEMCFT